MAPKRRTVAAMCPLAALLCLMTTGCSSKPDITLHPIVASVRIGGPSGIKSPPQANTWQLRLARNEAEAVQVQVLWPAEELPASQSCPAGDNHRLHVQADIVQLGGPAGPCQPLIKVYQVLDVIYRGPAQDATFKVPPRNLGAIPDLCLPTFRADAQRHSPRAVTFLFDVQAPAGAKPGLHRYRLSFQRYQLQPRQRPVGVPVSLELSVEVQPFALPVRLPFKTAVTWNWGIEKYLARPLTDKERLAYLDFFLDYRFTPASFFTKGVTFSQDELERIVSRGGNVFQLYQIGGGKLLSPEQRIKLEPQVRLWRTELKQAGAIDFCYALIADEPKDDALEAVHSNATWLKSVFPELKIWVASRPRAALMDVVDCWDVVTAHSTGFYTPHSHTADALAMARSAANKPEYWWFYSVEPYAPHPNARVDDELVDSRAIGWLSAKTGVDGFEYFWATDWVGNAELRDIPYPAKAERWNLGLAGAGMLCYPGADGLPIPSLRLINMRDGFEDWAALLMAPPAVRAVAMSIDPRDYEQLARARTALYQAIR